MKSLHVVCPHTKCLYQLRRYGKLLSNSNYWSEGALHSDVDHRHAKQILHSGLRYLREDIDTLKINLKNRGITLDVDSLVSNVCISISMSDVTLAHSVFVR